MAVGAGDGSLQISTTTGGKTYERNVPFTGTLVGPDHARKLLVLQVHKPSDTFSYQTFSPELGVVATVTATLIGTEDVKVDQQPISGLKLEESMSAMPGKMTVWLDHDGWLLRQLMPSPVRRY